MEYENKVNLMAKNDIQNSETFKAMRARKVKAKEEAEMRFIEQCKKENEIRSKLNLERSNQFVFAEI